MKIRKRKMKMNEWLRQNYDFKNEWILLTGASTGIGYEYLRLLSEMGCQILAVSNELEKMMVHKKEFESKFKNRIEPIHCDLSRYEEVMSLISRLSTYQVAVLINNAGFGLKGPFEKHSFEQYRDIVAVNSLAPVLLTRAILPTMQKLDRGVVIHVASINAYVPIPNNQVYTATKAFSMNYAIAVATENRQTKIRFQVVLPGTTLTPFHEKQGANPAMGTMLPDKVAEGSLNNLQEPIYIANRYDRIVPLLVRIFPVPLASRIAGYIAKKRLGIK
jgi:hypothetical protein